MREFWFSLSLSLLKEGRRWGEEGKKKTVILAELFRNIWYSISGEVPCFHLLSTQCHPSGPLGIICWHVLVWIFWKVDAEMKIVVQKVYYRGTCGTKRKESKWAGEPSGRVLDQRRLCQSGQPWSRGRCPEASYAQQKWGCPCTTPLYSRLHLE